MLEKKISIKIALPILNFYACNINSLFLLSWTIAFKLLIETLTIPEDTSFPSRCGTIFAFVNTFITKIRILGKLITMWIVETNVYFIYFYMLFIDS